MIDAVRAVRAVRASACSGPLVTPARCERSVSRGVAAAVRVVRHDVGGVRSHRDGGREDRLLPARRALVRERHRAEERSADRPEIADVRADVLRALVEPDAGDEAVAADRNFKPSSTALESSGRRVARSVWLASRSSTGNSDRRRGREGRRRGRRRRRRRRVAAAVRRASPDSSRPFRPSAPSDAPSARAVDRACWPTRSAQLGLVP